MLLFSVLLCIVVLVLLVILGTGVAAFLVNSTVAATVCEVISRIAFAASMLALMLVIVPRIRETLEGFGVELPWITVQVLKCSNWNAWQSIVIGLLMIGILVADGILFAILHNQISTRRIAQWGSFVITLILTAMSFFIIAALFIPMVRLMNDLS